MALTMDTLNPKKADLTSVFNLDRTDNTDRMYRIEAYNNNSKDPF